MLQRKAFAASAAMALAAAAHLAAQAPWLLPRGPAVQVNAVELGTPSIPVLALDPLGGLTAAWANTIAIGQNEILARRIGPDGTLGPAEGRIDHFGSAFRTNGALISLGPGLSVAAWINDQAVLSAPNRSLSFPSIEGRFLGADGGPASGPFAIETDGAPQSLHLAALRSTGFVAAWSMADSVTLSPEALVRRFNLAGEPVGPEIVLASFPRQTCEVLSRAVGALADGGFTAVWAQASAAAPGCVTGTFARRFSADGVALGPAVQLAADTGLLAAVRADGSFITLSIEAFPITLPVGLGTLTVQLYAPNGLPAGPPFAVALIDNRFEPAVAVDDGGNFLITWWDSGGPGNALAQLYNAAGEPLGFPFIAGEPGNSIGALAASDGQGRWALSWSDQGQQLFARSFSVCPEDGAQLCLGGFRYRVAVSWRDPRTGATGSGHAVPLTGDTGAFWFFDQQNLELMVKVLDGRAVNGHFWVFYGALSDVEYTLTVTDVATGAQQAYHNLPHTLASRADTEAFAAGAPVPVPSPIPPRSTGDSNPCVDRLCVGNGRFTVQVAWHDPRHGTTGNGTAVPLTDDTGAFWFFAPQNLELMIKVLDGRPVNGHFWVFFGSLSDVEYTLTVTDRTTGAVRTYHNPPYTLASRADTSAF